MPDVKYWLHLGSQAWDAVPLPYASNDQEALLLAKQHLRAIGGLSGIVVQSRLVGDVRITTETKVRI